MRRSAVLLKNLPSLVTWNVMGSTDLLHTHILDLTPNHDFCSTKLYCILSDSCVHAGSNRSPAVFVALGMQFNG